MPKHREAEKKEVCVQLPTYADNVALPTFARRMPLLQQSINICLPARPIAANLLWACPMRAVQITSIVTFGRSQLRSVVSSLILRSNADEMESRGMMSSPRKTEKMNFSQYTAPDRLTCMHNI